MTTDDLWRMRDEIIEKMTEAMQEGFRGVYLRQDATNGRVRAGEILSAEHSIRLKNLEREIWPTGGRRKEDPTDRPKGNITERDVRIVLATLASSGAVLGFFWKVLPLMLKAVAP